MLGHVLLPQSRAVTYSHAQERLQRLIAERCDPAADKAAIDQRIWELFGEDWAVMFTDLSGFSRGVAEFGIIHFLQLIYESLRVFAPCIEENDGIVLKVEGDSMLVLFRKPQNALAAAVAMQRAARDFNEGRDDTAKILLCVGLGFGRVLRIADLDVYGSEVNAASKLGEDTAEAWEVLVTGEFHDAVREYPGVTFERLAKAPSGAAAAYKAVY